MDWTEVKIATTHEGIEPVTALLLELGITGIVVEDARDFEQFLREETPRWDYVDESLEALRHCETSLTVYLPMNTQGADLFAALGERLLSLRRLDAEGRCGRLEARTAQVNEDDWANNWKKYFKPQPVGNRLLIKPTWEALDDSARGERLVLEIDPSASFGTGTHDSTRLCLCLLEESVRGGEAVLDMGCGSGILGIAAMLLGAGDVTAVDIDENSVRIARENFAQNRVPPEALHTYCGDVLSDGALREAVLSRRYSLITANIVADVIIAMAPLLHAALGEGGRLILSGIISERETQVRKAVCAQGLRVDRRRESGGWVALECVPGEDR